MKQGLVVVAMLCLMIGHGEKAIALEGSAISPFLYRYSTKMDFLGHWAFLQHTTSTGGSMTLCTGDIEVKRDGTFHIWNACNDNFDGLFHKKIHQNHQHGKT